MRKIVWKSFVVPREDATNAINFEKKKMVPLTKTKLQWHEDVIAW